MAALFLVPTPLGNLEDITLRALRVLREADLIACEDTRRTRKLLDHYGVSKPLVSFHEHNEAERAAELARRVAAGENVALVTDAGAPGISDPGYRAVRAALDAGLPVVPLPGPTAVETALIGSGLPVNAYRFCGFVPTRGAQRRKALEKLRQEEATLVFFEAPHRILAFLADAVETLGDRPAVVARELTKLHEEFLRGTLSSIHAELEGRPAVKGEITVLVAGGDGPKAPLETLGARVAELTAAGVDRRDALKSAARERGLSKREAYRLLQDESGEYDEREQLDASCD